MFLDNVYCHITSGLGAGLFAVICGSPVDVVKSRMMGAPRCAVLCCAVLRCAPLCSAVLRCAVLCCAALLLLLLLLPLLLLLRHPLREACLQLASACYFALGDAAALRMSPVLSHHATLKAQPVRCLRRRALTGAAGPAPYAAHTALQSPLQWLAAAASHTLDPPLNCCWCHAHAPCAGAAPGIHSGVLDCWTHSPFHSIR